jgi:hypothetical protein
VSLGEIHLASELLLNKKSGVFLLPKFLDGHSIVNIISVYKKRSTSRTCDVALGPLSAAEQF